MIPAHWTVAFPFPLDGERVGTLWLPREGLTEEQADRLCEYVRTQEQADRLCEYVRTLVVVDGPRSGAA